MSFACVRAPVPRVPERALARIHRQLPQWILLTHIWAGFSRLMCTIINSHRAVFVAAHLLKGHRWATVFVCLSKWGLYILSALSMCRLLLTNSWMLKCTGFVEIASFGVHAAKRITAIIADLIEYIYNRGCVVVFGSVWLSNGFIA